MALNDFVTCPGQGPGNKDSGSQSDLLPNRQRCDGPVGLTNFASMALALARLHSHSPQFWLKKNYKTTANLFKGLKPNS